MTDSENVYLDYQASTPLDPRVRALITSVSDVTFANPHAEDHAAGWRARAIIEDARRLIADSIGADTDEVIFTAGATEADNLGVLGAALGAPSHRTRILVSAIEHKAVLESAYGAERFGYSVEIIPATPDGVIDLLWLEAAVREDVAVISVMAVNNEIGTLQPISRVAEIGGRVGAFVHTDATQAPAAMDVDVLGWNVDAASFSSHKVYGPKGVGAFYLAASAPWRPRPLMFGGGQEGGLRPGTLPTELCAGFGLALSLMSAGERIEVAQMRDQLLARLEAAIPTLAVTCSTTARHPGCLHLRFEGVDGKDLVTRLQPTLSASTGSACTSGVMKTSHVLQAIGFSDDQAAEGVRLSIGRFTSTSDIEHAVERLAATVDDMRRVSA